MLTKGAIGNLVNRYKAVLAKCNLINTFGSLAVASMLVLGGAGVAEAAGAQWNAESIDAAEIIVKDTSINGYGIYTDPSVLSPKQSYLKTDATKVTLIDVEGLRPRAVDAWDGGHIVLGSAGSDLTINVRQSEDTTSGYKYIAAIEASRSYGYPDPSVEVNADKLTITAHAKGNDVAHALYTGGRKDDSIGAAKDTQIIINANQTDITVTAEEGGGAAAIAALSGSMIQVNGNLTVNAEGYSAIAARGKAIVHVGQHKETVKLYGDVDFDYNESSSGSAIDAEVKIGLTGPDSEWIGQALFSYDKKPADDLLKVSNLHLAINDGATWTPTPIEDENCGLVAITDLSLDGGNVNINENVEALAENVSGEGNINVADVEKAGTFKVIGDAAEAELNVQALNAKTGKVKTADEVTPERLAELQKQVQNAEGETLATTASAPEGDVEGAISIDKNGNAKQAKNTLMDAALKQASVTTVALDKILTNDVRKRLGDIRSDKNTTGVWMRWDGGKLQGNGLSNDFNTIQIGGDTKVGKNCRLGVAGTFTHGDAEFARGTAELEGFTFATYATWMGENGMFADVVARLGQFSNEMKVEGRTGDMDNRVFSLSGEYGWRLPVCDQFFVEPQVELAYTYVSSDDLELGTAKYAFDNVDSLTGRAGVVFGWNLPDDRGNVYARASVLQQFMGDAKISGTNGNAHNVQEIDGDDTWFEYGIGANVKLTEKTYIWADVERTEGAELDEEWRGTVGIRYSF